MDLIDNTRNQHFLPQIEQRMNAIDPTVAKEEQRIFEFEILGDRKGVKRLGEGQSLKISKNLAMLDLFSFNVDKSLALRQNFEALFQRYENEVERNTSSLLTKLAEGDTDVSAEVVSIYAAKLMNFARNPFSVVKILNTFGNLANYTPQDPTALALFNKVLNGRRKHQKHLCKSLDITDEQYNRWLRMLFNMLMELKPGFRSLFDETVRSVFTSKQFGIAVLVCTYSTPRCLLSDRAMTTNIANSRANGFDFNLNSRAFIRYIVMDRTPQSVPDWMPPEAIERLMSSSLPITLYREHDNEDLLRSFNKNVLSQSHSHVYCATDKNLVF